MKIDDLKQSQRVEDRRGQSNGSFGGYSGGGNSGLIGLLMQLLFSSGKGRLIIIAIIAITLITGGGSGIGDLLGMSSSNPTSHQTSQTPSTVSDEEAVFLSKVFQSTEEFWTQEFKKEGLTYNPPTLVIYDGKTQTGGCGVGSAHAGPFYCSADNKVYIDLTFYHELANTYGAKGDFAMAYVIAHEVGHHVQNELGTMDAYRKKHQTLSKKEANALNVRLELQADYYAGAWAHYVEGQGLLEIGDIEEAMNAAHAVGDDTLQEAANGTSVPESFTHGTSEQRQRWFHRGYQYGDLKHGDTFSGDI
ncbi:KPN_02809 family neutral zinc metallopeptidase [Streptococcus cameli]